MVAALGLPVDILENYGPLTDCFVTHTWSPNFVEMWRSHLPFWNYSKFKFLSVWLENAYSCPKMGVWGVIWPLNGVQCQRDPKMQILVWFHVIWVIKHENPTVGVTCSWVLEDVYKKVIWCIWVGNYLCICRFRVVVCVVCEWKVWKEGLFRVAPNLGF